MKVEERLDEEMAAYFDGEYMDSKVAKERLRDLILFRADDEPCESGEYREKSPSKEEA